MTGPQEVLLKCSPGDIVILKYVYGKFLLPLYPLQFCQQCHSGEHESLLLLCDGCDKGTHTYCCKVDYHVQYVVYLCDENCVDQ